MNELDTLNVNNLHHAYLIEGDKGFVLPQLISFLNKNNLPSIANPDFFYINLDIFKMEDARNLKSVFVNKSFSGKKIIIISTNNFLNEAQNALLKIFEETPENTHLFFVLPDSFLILPTLKSRFSLIFFKKEIKDFSRIEDFMKMSLSQKIDFLKQLLIDDEEDVNDVFLESKHTKANLFLNELEFYLNKIFKKSNDIMFYERISIVFEHIFRVRKNLKESGSSSKNLLESVAFSVSFL